MGLRTVEAHRERWVLLGDAIRHRREELGLLQRHCVDRSDGLVSQSLWSALERGPVRGRVTVRALRGVSIALDWVPDACEQILDGADASTVETRSASLDRRLLEMFHQLSVADRVLLVANGDLVAAVGHLRARPAHSSPTPSDALDAGVVIVDDRRAIVGD